MIADCTRCATPLEHGDLRCAVCALVVAAAPEAAPAERARVVRCTACAAAIAFSPDVQAPHCSFCGAVATVEQPVDPIESAQLRLPFAVERDQAGAALRAWLGQRGWLAPGDLAAQARLEKLVPLSWAAWVVQADALVSWTADSNAGSHRSDWAPHSGQIRMTFENIVVPASRGLSFDECAKLTRSYDLSAARAVGADDAQVGPVEEFDAQRSAARRTVLQAIEAHAAHRLQQQRVIPGSRFRKVKVGVLLEGLTTRRVALPVWILAYRYRGAPYRALVHGQQAGCVVGKAPVSTAKIAAIFAVVIAVIVLIAALLSGGR